MGHGQMQYNLSVSGNQSERILLYELETLKTHISVFLGQIQGN